MSAWGKGWRKAQKWEDDGQGSGWSDESKWEEEAKFDSRSHRLYYPGTHYKEKDVDRYGRPKTAAPWYQSGYVAGSTQGEGGYNMPGGSNIPPSHRINLVVPFTPQSLDFDWYKTHQFRCLADDIKFGVRNRHNHSQMDIIAKKESVTTDQILDALSAVMVQAEEMGFDWTCVEPRHDDMSGWMELVRPRMGSAQKGGARKQMKRRRRGVGGGDTSTSGPRWVPRRADVGGGESSARASREEPRRVDVGGGDPSARGSREEQRRDDVTGGGPMSSGSQGERRRDDDGVGEPSARGSREERRRDDVRGGDPSASTSHVDVVENVSGSEDTNDSLDILAPNRVPVHIGSFGWRTLGPVARERVGPSKFDTWKHLTHHPSEKEVQKYFRGYGGVDPIPAEDILILSALSFVDPQHIKNRRQHIGLNTELLVGTFGEDVADLVQANVMHPILTEVAAFLREGRECETPKYVIFYRRSGRHRSVMCANILRNILEDWSPNRDLQGPFYFDNWTHFCEFHWRTVRCQLTSSGPCELCSEDSYRRSPAARKVLTRLANFFCYQLAADA